MHFVIQNMTTVTSSKILAEFDVSFPDIGLVLRRVCLSRPRDAAADVALLHFPEDRKTHRAAFFFTGKTRARLGQAACAAVEAMTGEPTRYQPCKDMPTNVSEEDDAAGLRRTVRADVEEACARAGL